MIRAHGRHTRRGVYRRPFDFAVYARRRRLEQFVPTLRPSGYYRLTQEGFRRVVQAGEPAVGDYRILQDQPVVVPGRGFLLLMGVG
jgi:hypothetical protein